MAGSNSEPPKESALVAGLSKAVTLCVVEKYKVVLQATTGSGEVREDEPHEDRVV